MADLEAFSSVAQPIVYCRASRVWSEGEQRWLTWRQTAYNDLFDWPAKFPVSCYARAWDSRVKVSGGLTYTRFRERVRQVAYETLSYLPGVIVVHDFNTLLDLVSRYSRVLVLPVDDDDWFSPNVASYLVSQTIEPETEVVVWRDLTWWCDFDGTRFFEKFGVQPLSNVKVAFGSNCYALTKRAFRKWDSKSLQEALDKHWRVTKLVEPQAVAALDAHLSFGVKHIGCTSVLLVETGNDYWWNTDADSFQIPEWARQHCDKVRQLHQQLLQDMGGHFDRPGLIQDTERLARWE